MGAQLPANSDEWLRKMAMEVAGKLGIWRSEELISDLIQEGYVVMFENLHRVESEKGNAFGYLRGPVRRAMYDMISVGVIAIPTRVRREIQKVRKASADLAVTLGRPATDAEIAAVLDMTLDAVKRILTRDLRIESGDAVPEGATSHWDRLASDEVDPLDRLIQKETTEILYGSLAALPHREAAIIRQRFGFENEEETKTLKELAVDFNITFQRVQQLERQAYGRIRKRMAN